MPLSSGEGEGEGESDGRPAHRWDNIRLFNSVGKAGAGKLA
jgi:hypothetical protein